MVLLHIGEEKGKRDKGSCPVLNLKRKDQKKLDSFIMVGLMIPYLVTHFKKLCLSAISDLTDVFAI